MTRFNAAVYRFGQPVREDTFGVADAVQLVRDRAAAAVLLDVVEPCELEAWWSDAAFPEATPHRNLPSTVNTGVAVGPTQRLVGRDLVSEIIDYVSYGSKHNGGLKHTAFVKLVGDALNADAVRIGRWGELPIVSKREFQPKGGTYSIPPHCDAIQFARDPLYWPFSEGYVDEVDQVSVFLNVADSAQGTGLLLWDHRPRDLAELDEIMQEFKATGAVERLSRMTSVVVNGRPGQLYVLNTRVLHAVQQCTAPRKTLGSFLVWHDQRWHMFQ